MMAEHESSIVPEHTVAQVTRMNALRMLAEPLIGHAVEGETLARMIEQVTRKDVLLLDVQAELDRLYVEKG